MLAVTVIKNTVTKRLWNFQIHFLPYSNAFEEKFFLPNMFFYHFLQLCPRGHISKMLAVTVLKTRLLSAFGIFKSISCLIRMRLRKNFSSKHVLLSFLQLCPRGHISKMLAVTVIKTRLLSAFGIFKSISCLIRMRLRKNFSSKHVLLSFSSTLSRGHISKMLAVTVIKNTVTKRLWNFQIHFLPYSNAFEENFSSKHVLLSFSSTLSPRSYLENACCNRY